MNPNSTFLKYLLLPLSLLFGLLVAIKNSLYQTGFFTGVRFSIPVIGVGNLTVGGAGKTPHVEHLVRMLKTHLQVAVMSRGFGRQTTGFVLVVPSHRSADAGDESLIFARKYPDIAVAVSESRSVGIPQLLQHRPETQVVLLDDAFQHRSVSVSLNILLTEYNTPFFRDWLLPSGTLREWRSGYKRADIIIVTKCPPAITEEDRDSFLRGLRLGANQQVYFSTYKYHLPYAMFATSSRIDLLTLDSVLLVCGIAKPGYLIEYIEEQVERLDVMQFKDHYDYKSEDLQIIESRFRNLQGDRKVLLTTEKDAVRLEPFADFLISHNIPVFLLPVEVVFLFQGENAFTDHIRSFLLDFRV